MANARAQLTPLIVTPGDLKRARREFEALDEALRQSAIRASSGGTAGAAPGTSRALDELVTASGISLGKASDRTTLLKQLADLVAHAPVVHFSFASDPSAAFLGKLIEWLRTNIHPAVLVDVGLQPSIAAGCVVRTANKQFDFSLKSAFDAQRDLLIESIVAVTPTAAAPAEQPVEAVATAATPSTPAAKPSAKEVVA